MRSIETLKSIEWVAFIFGNLIAFNEFLVQAELLLGAHTQIQKISMLLMVDGCCKNQANAIVKWHGIGAKF